MSSSGAAASGKADSNKQTSGPPPAQDRRRSSSKGKDKYEGNPDHNLPGIGNYMFVKQLGEGNFAKVKLARHKITGQEVAIKIIDKTKLDEKKLSKLYREVKIMKLLQHPNIVKLYEVIETKATVFLVMEVANGGELYDYLVVHGRMKEKEARAKFRQILSAVSYCHKKRVIHRDLKAENLLLDQNLNVKIADFGFSNLFDPDDKLDTFCGSPPYAAPELFQGRKYTGPEVDVWSLGVILYVLTTGCLPFDGKNLAEMRESVCRGKYRVPFYLSDGCEKLLKKFLVRDPSKRSSLDMLIDDPWINEGFDDSPITSDVSQRVLEDDEILTSIERKYHLSKAAILKSLRENLYDEIAAIYYLMYNEKLQKGEISVEDERTRSIPSTDPSKAAMAIISEDAALKTEQARKASQAAPLPPTPVAKGTEGDGEEEEVVQPLGKTPVPAARKRRFTVTNAADAQKLLTTEQTPLQTGLQATGTPLVQQGQGKEESDIATAADAAYLNREQGTRAPSSAATTMGRRSIPNEEGGQAGAPPLAAEGEEEEAFPGQKPPPTNATAVEGSSDRPVSARKRHNTFVGIMRNIRRTSAEEKEGTANPPTAGPSPATSGATTSGEGPRSLRFTFNSNSTSSKEPEEIIQEILGVLQKRGIEHAQTAPYLISCTTNFGTLKFEIEVCKLPRLKNLHGLRFRRVTGQASDYKVICEQLLQETKLT